jgi:hypothetical protein
MVGAPMVYEIVSNILSDITREYKGRGEVSFFNLLRQLMSRASLQ